MRPNPHLTLSNHMHVIAMCMCGYTSPTLEDVVAASVSMQTQILDNAILCINT